MDNADNVITTVADQGEGPGGPGSPLFLDQNEARRTEKIFLYTGPSYLRVWMTPPPPPLYEALAPPLNSKLFLARPSQLTPLMQLEVMGSFFAQKLTLFSASSFGDIVKTRRASGT